MNMNNKIVIGFLMLAGLIGLFVGGGLAFFPAQLQTDNGIILSSASHFSEARAPGATILVASCIILTGAFRQSLWKFSLSLSALFFLSYGSGRLLSLVMDGRPADGLFYAMIGEFMVGAIAAVLLMKTRSLSNE